MLWGMYLKLALGICNLRQFDIGWGEYEKKKNPENTKTVRKQWIRKKKCSNQSLQEGPKAAISL